LREREGGRESERWTGREKEREGERERKRKVLEHICHRMEKLLSFSQPTVSFSILVTVSVNRIFFRFCSTGI
jgi:hypothetical protein